MFTTLCLVCALCICILLLIIYKGLWNERYWKDRNVTFHPQNKVMGVFWEFLTKDRAIFENLHEIYKQYPNEPAVGIGSFFSPALYVLDPVNIQHILATNFNAFNHRGFEGNEGDLLAQNLFFLNGKKWKLVRQSLTPVFTSSKLKSMYHIMEKSAQDFVTYLNENPHLKRGDIFNTLSVFCSAAVTAAVFGINTNSIFDSPLLKMAQTTFRPSLVTNLKFTVATLCSPLFKLLQINIFKEHEDFFIGTFKAVLRQCEEENFTKHNFVNTCIAIRNRGILKDLDTGIEIEPTDELLAAQAFFFYLAGVEPTAAAMQAVLTELGSHADILQKVHKEIDDVFEQSNGVLTYDTVSDMKYLEMAMQEALRLHGPIGYLSRQCVQDTVLPVGNIKIEKGTKLFTPIYEVHHDKKYYPDPERFDPERFSKDNKNLAQELAYMPFGKGNRVCIGMRYAQLQAKSGLIHFLRHFTVRTTIPETGLKYGKEPVQVRIKNATIEILDRKSVKAC